MEAKTTTRNSILVVEDSPNERAGLCALLERSGFAVGSASDGVEALEEIERRNFDLLLVDVGLPRMNGLKMLSHLPDTHRPKVLVITGDDTAETVLGALREHAERCITKPIEPKALVQTIRNELEAPAVADKIQVLSADPRFVELRIPCERSPADRVQDYFHQLDSGLPPKERHSVELAFHELLMNAIEWGGRMDPGSEVQVTFLRTDRLLMFRIADPGPGFDFANLEHAAAGYSSGDPGAHIEARNAKGLRPGGFGIVLARSLVDEVLYNEAHNEVVLLKYLDRKRVA